ncbi:opine dehydrogenase [Oscillibacter sp. PC13]|uniref:NAD/NADP octopine/nopaline dehydrogenase family protein n=1 Tax=Oscillibacter sp. PC13 TaxID=1855299 RepID=UPI0008E7311C|nr:NAD/NADP octopine/nopaline dehydrogenase family protein [Oscillibacter sp. PC13]SFP64084.1 opine dehydrogenase [Oscillibacter sp. PC13]
MIEKITVIGGGSTGHMVAAVMAMRGFKVTLTDTERFSEQLDAVKKLGGIQLRGGMRGTGVPEKVTTDPAEAIPGAELICVDVPADRHEEIARWIAPYLEDGQHILIIPGNLGSFIFRKVFQELGVTADVTLTEKEGNFGPCRLTAPAEVTTGMPLNLKGKIASLPASDTEKVIKALEGVVEYTANQNVFEGTINAGNVINHVASTILSSAEIDHKGNKFSLFKYAFTPAAVRCIGKIRNERKAVIEAMGMTEHGNPVGMVEMVQHIDEHPEIHVFYEYMDGPYALDHRYLHEDCGCGGAFAVSVAKRLGLEMPVLTAFLGVAGAINDRDYLNGGRTLENLGFPEGMTLEEIYKQI